MSNVLTRERTGETNAGIRDVVREPLSRALQEAVLRAGGRSDGRVVIRPFVLVDFGPVVDGLFDDEASTAESVRREAESVLGSTNTGDRGRAPARGERGGGGSTLPRLLLLGVVVGLAYVLGTRTESVDRLIERAPGRVRELGEAAADRSGEVADRTETVTETAAERIRETGGSAADRVEKTGETASDRIEEGGEATSERADEAADTVEEATQADEESSDEE